MPKSYTKHYYAGSERLASSIGQGGWCSMSPDVISETQTEHEYRVQKHWNDMYINEFPFEYYHENPPVLTQNVDIYDDVLSELQYRCPVRHLRQLNISLGNINLWAVMQGLCGPQAQEDVIYYTHGDHLGSANWITDFHGVPVQYIHYLPYGQLLANQAPYGYDERYKFTGKERDAESGYDYFGARFYWSLFKHWTSVDPLVDNYLHISPYAYCNWNPVKFVDPDGRDIYRYDSETGDIKLHQKTDDNFDQFGKFKYDRKTGEYELQIHKDGSIKTYTDHGGNNDKIAKGILRDGLNIKQKGSNFISDNNAGPTLDDYNNFALILDEVAGAEISGYVFEFPEDKNRRIVRFEPYNDNSYNRSRNRIMNFSPYTVLQHFHTHGHANTYFDATTPSEGFDIPFKNKITSLYPDVQLLILHNYGMPIRY